MKLSSFHLFGKTFCSPPLKSLSCCKIGSHVLDSWYYVEKYQPKLVTCYCCLKNFGKYSQIGCFKVRNAILKTLTFWQLPWSNMLQNKSFMGEITGNLAHQSPRGNMHKFFDCIRTPLKHFLVCLTFYR